MFLMITTFMCLLISGVAASIMYGKASDEIAKGLLTMVIVLCGIMCIGLAGAITATYIIFTSGMCA